MTASDSLHHCPSCGYELAPLEGEGDLTCPECGEPTTRNEAASHLEKNLVKKFYRYSAIAIIGPTLIPNAVLVADVFTTTDLLGVFLFAWMLCVPISSFGLSIAVVVAYRRSPWQYRRRMRARWFALMIIAAIFSAGGWYAIYRFTQMVIG